MALDAELTHVFSAPMQSRRHPFVVGSLFSLVVILGGVGCGSPPQYMAKDAGPDTKSDGPQGSGGSAGAGSGGHSSGSGGIVGAGSGGGLGSGGTGVGSGGTVATGTGGAMSGAGGVIAPGSGGAGQGGKAGGTQTATGGTGAISSGGAGGMKAGSGGAGPGTGGTPPGTGGMVGAGGSPGCTGTQKMCNGSCIAMNECCPTCTGNKPVCMNGTTCVGKTNGTTCASGAECGTGNCVDGVCCDSTCTGNCESCSTASAKGTCSPSTTPRAACVGTGTCAGKCDGTAAHRAACTFPSNTTSCGAAASCTAGSATTAALCDGAGACVAGTVMSCMFGCRTDSMPLCADSCPANQSLCGGSTCVDTLSTAAHCGSTCTQCRNSTPDCVQSKCVQCTNSTECRDAAHTSLNLGANAVCNTSTHNCMCATKDPGNVLTNPGFDTDLSGWHAANDGSTIAFAFSDGFFCSASGSATTSGGFGGIQQCARITGGSNYFLGAMYFMSGGTGSPVDCSVEYHANANCDDASLGNDNVSGSSTSGWSLMHKAVLKAPSNATYALVGCAQFESGLAQVDQIYLNSTTDGF